MLPTIRIGDHDVTRLICGGNPFSAISHVTHEMDQEMLHYYSMPCLQETLLECRRQGINTFQSRGDRHQMRMYIEHLDNGGDMQWIAQTASEFADLPGNIRQITSFKPIAIYHHGTHTDNSWYKGQMDLVGDVIKCIKDHGLPAGIGTHIPDVVKFCEDQDWGVDFYMTCVYQLARGYKSAPMVDQNAYAKERFVQSDWEAMTAVVRQTDKPCLAFKIMAASRNCATPESVRAAFQRAFDQIKPADAVVVGMFPKHSDQIAENAGYVRELLEAGAPAS